MEDIKNINVNLKNSNINSYRKAEEVEISSNENEIYNSSNKIIVGNYSKAPDYLKDNEYIKNGYLINCHSIKLVLRSLFVCSNETINIWSHLIGCIISITLIILTSIYVKRANIKELNQAEYELLKIQINETIIPWSSELYNFKIMENQTIDLIVCTIIDNILSNTDEIVSNSNSRVTIIKIMKNFVEKTKKLINNIIKSVSKIKNKNIFDILTTKWEICSNKIYSYILKNGDIKGENVKRWPLFIMLSASIACLGCSAIFHWFSIYNKQVYAFLSRLDYAGITFLIPGSCYPPYFFFYYCEKCKFYFLLTNILNYRDRKNIFSNNFYFIFFCIYFNFISTISWTKI